MSQPDPTGRHEQRDGQDYLVMERRFSAPIDAVWAAVTEPERLARWIGTWDGDPTCGSVDFRMTAESEDAPVERHRILACDPPRRLVTESAAEQDDPVWRLELNLAEDGGVTTLTFAQRVDDGIPVDSVGPGWDYYLDRLVAAESGGDPAAVDFDDYYPSQSEHYRAAFS
jgi:uncharacterized protein YndB with AHSA1/START domain